jgi:hypothetical protein
MERNRNPRRIFPTLPKFGPSVGRIVASYREYGTGRSATLRGPFPTRPTFGEKRLGDVPFRFLGDPRCCPGRCTSGRKTVQGSVPTQPRSDRSGSCQQIAGRRTSERTSCRDFVPIRTKLQKGKETLIRYTTMQDRDHGKQAVLWP